MTKSLTIILLLLILANSVFSQNTKEVKFIDAVYEKPVSGVMVFYNGDFVSVSDINGNCQIDDHQNKIYCKYFGYNDTLVNIEDCEQCEIKLETNYTLLNEVKVDAKYNPKRHLLKLLKESQQTAYKLDTTIYYKFKEINKIPELGQIEIFTGILRIENKGYSKKGNLIFISEISNYYNSIKQEDIYEQLHTSKIWVHFIIRDILYPARIKKIKRNNEIKRLHFVANDTISFLLINKNNNVTTNCNYINFTNNRIESREFVGSIQGNNRILKFYSKIDYALHPISIPKRISASREYVLENNLVVNNYVELDNIDNPDIETELNIFLYAFSCKLMVERAKFKFPDIIIPSELLEN